MESIDEPIASISFPLCSSTPLKPLISLEPVSTDDEIQIVDAHFPETLQPLVSQQPDVTADDKQTKKEKKVDIRDGRIENVVPGNKSSYTHYLRRQYGTHQASYKEHRVSSQRIISTAFSKYNIKSRYAVVQYIHRDSEEGDIVIKAHGNAKDSQSRPFFKTGLSVLDNIKEETRETKPRRLFKKLVDDAGGLLYSSSASSEPRNLQQIYNI
ncbi:WAC [Mytilus coruscus]|uniref:WAC n=1 Tax=Mytilus coruscus TaxID=42192 RepID=A0A6J8EVZ6_MYTCO|nr:WAC [Mytilus coruscus]